MGRCMKHIMSIEGNKNYYVISYDISNDRLRTRLAKLLEGYGVRVHYSVFECRLDIDQYKVLFERMKEYSKKFESDSIRIYRICKNCEKEIETLGNLKKEYEVAKSQVIVI